MNPTLIPKYDVLIACYPVQTALCSRPILARIAFQEQRRKITSLAEVRRVAASRCPTTDASAELCREVPFIDLPRIVCSSVVTRGRNDLHLQP